MMCSTSEIVRLARQAIEVLKPYLPAPATGVATKVGKKVPDTVRALR